LRPPRATDAERARMHDDFVALCTIASPSRAERACGTAVRERLELLGLEVTEDDAGAQIGGDQGNLLARIPGSTDRSILLCAHLDTVEPVAAIEPVLVDGTYVNANAGILGADNKAAVAVFLALARRLVSAGAPPAVGVELLFTPAEETALAGAAAFDVRQLRSHYGYVLDHATAIGEVVVASPTYYRLDAEFRGQSAHAGIRPEAGRSAVLAAARAVVGMSLGRLDDETTANVGRLDGGGPSTNVVPDRCRLEAETRSLDVTKVEASVAAMVDAIYEAANATHVDVDVDVRRLFSGYRQRGSTPAVVTAEAALTACGFTPKRIVTGGGSDANAFESAGFTCVNLANGTERNHQPDEAVSVAALDHMLDVAIALVEAAAAC
jgi:tripeptide aminopeptidase